MNDASVKTTSVRPWYREPWPWILAAGPFVVIVAGIYTAWLAISTNDGLVTEDYYRKGLSANQTIARSAEAARMGLTAAVRIRGDELTVRLQAAGTGFPKPSALVVTIMHPTRAGLDQSRQLPLAGDAYSGSFQLPAAGHWLVLLEDEGKTWRLMGNVVLPSNDEVLIGSSEAAAANSSDLRKRVE
jgi:hypothetical protein